MKRGNILIPTVLLAASSALAQTDIAFTSVHPLASNQVELMWSSDTNRWYAIERTVALTNWSNDFDFVIPDDSAPIASNHWTLTTDTNPCFFRLFAGSPVGTNDNFYTNMGTASNDTQVVVGTVNMDYAIQHGEGGEDFQYISGRLQDDWAAQFGGTGSDTQTVLCGSGDDWAYQDAGGGDDTLYVHGGDGNDLIMQRGGEGSDDIETRGDEGNDSVWQIGGAGHDTLRYEGGSSDGADFARLSGGSGNDIIALETVADDTFYVDGGPDSDTLTIEWGEDTRIELTDGTPLYTDGTESSLIRVVDVELIYVVGTNQMTNWSWSAP